MEEKEGGSGGTEMFEHGQLVERSLDGLPFAARILNCSRAGKGRGWMYSIEYLDDGNTEDEVPSDCLQAIDRSTAESMVASAPKAPELPRPLEGIVADDAEVAAPESPRVIIHSTSSTDPADAAAELEDEDAIIINGPEKSIASGSGLRGIRYLRGYNPAAAASSSPK